MPMLEQLGGYAILAGAVVMAGAMVRTARRGWARHEDGRILHRHDNRGAYLTMQAFQMASVVVLMIVCIKVINRWQ